MRSRESALNIETEVASTSFGYSEFIPPDSGRDFDSDGVEIVRFQLAQIEYHPTATVPTRDIDSESESGPSEGTSSPGRFFDDQSVGEVPTDATVAVATSTDARPAETRDLELRATGGDGFARTPSADTSKSDDSESSETQSLMADNCDHADENDKDKFYS